MGAQNAKGQSSASSRGKCAHPPVAQSVSMGQTLRQRCAFGCNSKFSFGAQISFVGANSDNVALFLTGLWPKNYEFVQELTELGLWNDYIYSITTGVSIGAIILVMYFVGRIALEYIYNPRTVAPAGLYVRIVIIGLSVSLVCVYLVKFKDRFDIYGVNIAYSALANCFIITGEMFAAVFLFPRPRVRRSIFTALLRRVGSPFFDC